MKFTILGTGKADVTECFNTCFVFSDDKNGHFLVDTGGGNQILKRLLDAGIETGDVHDIFITHEHLDHLLGVFWMIRIAGQMMDRGIYEGELRIYAHSDLIPVIQTFSEQTIAKKAVRFLGDRIQLNPLEHGDRKMILDCPVTFFDIESSKAKQYGFNMILPGGTKVACCGDEPYHECEYEFVKDSDWLMHEAFCMYKDVDIFKPYDSSHSTVREACELAERLQIPNLILYHTEETNLAKRKEWYTQEGKQFYHGNLYVPDDMESFSII